MIEPMLALSTAHVTDATCNGFIPAVASCRPYYAKGDYGWFIWVEEDATDIPDDLMTLFTLARRSDCCWIMLDRDGPTIVGLPIYDW